MKKRSFILILVTSLDEMLMTTHDRNSSINRANANATLRCPLNPGEYEIVQTVDLPEEIPKGWSFLLLFPSLRLRRISLLKLPPQSPCVSPLFSQVLSRAPSFLADG